ncbi:MAG: iron-sulfur cluster assembly accessory protein [Gammaproteobacteria bacterium]|nr:iron-sulfur cluster assembly accessory protein [Gammaproteobacteria bacterium]MCP5200726.1 iron-sulfur cluster assembly accessory protein [Gammaproteobacteria bacterium]
MPITLTERAARHVRDFMSREHNPHGLRLAVKPTGCSGYMYVVELAEQVQEHDQVFESHGISIVVDPQSLGYLEGTEVDYAREGLNEGFRFDNPNVTATCGCGESFSL